MSSPAPSEESTAMDWAPSQDAEPSEGPQDSRSFEVVPDAEEDDASLITENSFSWPGGTAAGTSSEGGSPPGPGPLAELFRCPDCGQEPTNGWCPMCHLTRGIGMPPGTVPVDDHAER